MKKLHAYAVISVGTLLRLVVRNNGLVVEAIAIVVAKKKAPHVSGVVPWLIHQERDATLR